MTVGSATARSSTSFGGLMSGARILSNEQAWDVLAAVLLGLAAVGSSVSVYLSASWNSVQSLRFGEAAAARVAAVSASDLASSQSMVDVSVFIAMLEARARGDEKLEAFLERRVRAEFRPALEAWRAL